MEMQAVAIGPLLLFPEVCRRKNSCPSHSWKQGLLALVPKGDHSKMATLFLFFKLPPTV